MEPPVLPPLPLEPDEPPLLPVPAPELLLLPEAFPEAPWVVLVVPLGAELLLELPLFTGPKPLSDGILWLLSVVLPLEGTKAPSVSPDRVWP